MHSLENQHLKIQVLEHGAELQSIYHKEYKREFLWQGDQSCWSRKSPVLFPIVGKLANNTYYVKGRDYHLSQHGFARDMDFELVEKSSNKLKFVLKANEKTMALYPYDFKLSISYRLEKSTVVVKYKVYNNSSELMYFSIGGHPAFNTNLSENGIEDYFLDFYDKKTLKSKVFDTEVGLLTKEEKLVVENKSKLDLNYDLFKDDALLFEGLKGLSIKNKINKQVINMTFDDFPICGVWTSRTSQNCPFISIEPLSGIADTAGVPKELIDKEFIQSIYPDDKYSTKFTIEIK